MVSGEKVTVAWPKVTAEGARNIWEVLNLGSQQPRVAKPEEKLEISRGLESCFLYPQRPSKAPRSTPLAGVSTHLVKSKALVKEIVLKMNAESK